MDDKTKPVSTPAGAESELSVGLAAGYAFTGAPELVPNVVFNCGSTGEVMRLDKDGMTYKGQRIEDGGEAHKAFLEVMVMMKAANV